MNIDFTAIVNHILTNFTFAEVVCFALLANTLLRRNGHRYATKQDIADLKKEMKQWKDETRK